MAELPAEARVVCDLLHGEIEDLFDRKLSSFADTLTKSINSKFDAAQASYSSQLNELRDEISFGDAPAPRAGASPLPPVTSKPILATQVGGPPKGTSPVAPVVGSSSAAVDSSPNGRHEVMLHRGKDYPTYVPPPTRGMKSESHPPPSASHEHQNSDAVDVFGTGPRVKLPKFDGSNPRLWQDRCEDYFTFWGTPPHM
jgi:hypothetical protein